MEEQVAEIVAAYVGSNRVDPAEFARSGRIS